MENNASSRLDRRREITARAISEEMRSAKDGQGI